MEKRGRIVIKKASAVIFSIVYYVGVCAIAAYAAISTNQQNLFIYGFPVLVVAYFVPASKMFYDRLKLNRWLLWLLMNAIGALLCVTAATIAYPHLWINLFILFIIVPPGIVFLVLWSIVGICYFFTRQRQARQNTPASDVITLSKENTPHIGKADVCKGVKHCMEILSILCLVLALSCIGAVIQKYPAYLPADAYSDMGVYTFTPVRVYPTQEEYRIRVGRGWQDSTRTVYNVEYRAASDGYGYHEETYSEKEAQSLLREGVAVQKRVLTVNETGRYLTIAPEETAESYVTRYRMSYITILAVCMTYLLGFSVFYLYRWRKSKIKAEEFS